ncbi:MAG: DUF1801 domain-containing protein [Methyloligellaceae bacterium]
MSEITPLMRFPSAKKHDPAIDAWLNDDFNELYAIARYWFERMRECGSDIRELMHDGCPTACVGDAAFAYVNVFRAHMNVGFFLGAFMEDPNDLLEGTGKRMRHVKIRPGKEIDEEGLRNLVKDSYRIVKKNL